MNFDCKFILDKEYRRGVTSLNEFARIIRYFSNNKGKKVLIDLTNYRYINPGYAVIIAAIPYIAEKTGNYSVIRYRTGDKKCNDFLKKSGILKHYKNDNNRNICNLKGSVDFLIIKNNIDNDEILEVCNSIINNFPVKLDDDARHELISIIYEIFSNSTFHSKENYAFCCGFLNHRKSLTFSIYDIGIGIPNSVNNYLKELNEIEKTPSEALTWAWQQGNSTLNGKLDYPRGAGFHTLESFVVANEGNILVGSDSAYCKISKQQKFFGDLSTPILGTFFSLEIKKDMEHKYSSNNDIIIAI